MFSRNSNEVTHLDIYNRIAVLETTIGDLKEGLKDGRKQLATIDEKVSALSVTSGISKALVAGTSLIVPLCVGGIFWIYGQVVRLEQYLQAPATLTTPFDSYGNHRNPGADSRQPLLLDRTHLP